MHICFPFVGDSLGGSHISTLILIAELIQRGFEVTIVCHCSGPLKKEIEARRLSAETLEISSDIGRRGGLVSYCADTSRSFRPIYQFLKKIRPDVIHTNDMRVHLYWSIPARLRHTPVVWHQRTFIGKSKLAVATMYLSTHIVAISQSVAGSIPRLYRRKLTVIPNPVEEVWLDSRLVQSANLEMLTNCFAPSTKKPILIGAFGALRELKKPFIFVDVIEQLVKRHGDNIVGFMFGKDLEGLSDRISRAAQNKGVAKNIVIMGFCRPIEPFMKSCNLLLATSTGDAFGRTLIEGMSLGVPIVAVKAGGHKEIIEHEINGLMADPDNVGDIVNCVQRVLQDEHLKGTIVRNGYKSVREKYNVRKHTDDIWEIYSKVVTKF